MSRLALSVALQLVLALGDQRAVSSVLAGTRVGRRGRERLQHTSSNHEQNTEMLFGTRGVKCCLGLGGLP